MWLPEVGAYYYKARMYSPVLGRFMQTDPIGYAGGVNLYAYVGNDPVNMTDPLGLEEADAIVVTGTAPCAGGSVRINGHCAAAPGEGGGSGVGAPIVVTGHRLAPQPAPPEDPIIVTAPHIVPPPVAIGGAVFTRAAAPRPTIQQYRCHHNGMVEKTARDYLSAGYSVAYNVSLRKVGPHGSFRAVADFIATVPGSGQYEIHEIKTGDARLSRNQSVVYDTGYLQVVGNAGLPIGLENGDIVPFVYVDVHRFGGCQL